jgi:excisionase family DNA binding protein
MKLFLWPHEVAELVGVSSRTVCRLADAGAVEVLRDAKNRRRFRPDAVQVLREKLGLPIPDDVKEPANVGPA